MSMLWDDFYNNLWTYVGFVHFLLKFLPSSTLFLVTGYVNVLSANLSFYHNGKCIVAKVVSFRYFFFQQNKTFQFKLRLPLSTCLLYKY